MVIGGKKKPVDSEICTASVELQINKKIDHKKKSPVKRLEVHF